MADETQNENPIGILVSPNILKNEYLESSSPGFLIGIDYLSKKYEHMRRIVGDGNCFYRAFLFGYLEELLRLYNSDEEVYKKKAEREHERILSVIVGSKDELIELGYSEIAIESFYDLFIELLGDLFSFSRESLLNQFQSDGNADYYTWYMRILTAGYIRRNVDIFLPFVLNEETLSNSMTDGIDGGGGAMDMGARLALFCSREVEPMGREVEQLQVLALCSYLGVQTEMEYLDGRTMSGDLPLVRVLDDDNDDDTVDVVVEEEAKTKTKWKKCPVVVTLLYRPGHYDILYGKSERHDVT